MIVKCKEEDRGDILAYLLLEPIYNTYIISDIDKHGFDQEYQKVYKQVNENGTILGVFLQYYSNFILAGEEGQLDYKGLADLIEESRSLVIMGKKEILEKLKEKLADPVNAVCKRLYCKKSRGEAEADESCTRAVLDDVDEIHQFLMTIPAFKNLYGEKAMIKNRLLNEEGAHVFIKDKGQIIAHANSAASTERSSMIGGVCVRDGFRNKGYAKRVLKEICRIIGEEKKIPCIFVDQREREYGLLTETGFEYYGDWMVIQKQEVQGE